MKEDKDILNVKLLGQFISRFSVGDTWEMFIGENCLSAHTIEFNEESMINKLIQTKYDKYEFSIDKELISKSALLTANLRKTITDIKLDELKNLKLNFENGSTLIISTDTDIVDWQWCLNKSGKDPYVDYEIACFWAGETKIK